MILVKYDPCKVFPMVFLIAYKLVVLLLLVFCSKKLFAFSSWKKMARFCRPINLFKRKWLEVFQRHVWRLVSSLAVSASSVSSTAAATTTEVSSASSPSSSSEWSSGLLVHFCGNVVFCVYFACKRFFCWFQCAISANV